MDKFAYCVLRSIRWVLRSIGGDFWIRCGYCDGILPLDKGSYEFCLKHLLECKSQERQLGN